MSITNTLSSDSFSNLFPPEQFPFLYCTSTNRRVHYARAPSTQLSVSRFINGQPYWRQPSKEGELERARLVLCDWSLYSYKPHELKAYVHLLKALAGERFQLFAWQEGHVVSFHPGRLYDYTFRKKLLATSRNEVLAAMPGKKTAHLLDYVSLRQLLGIEIAGGLDNYDTWHRGVDEVIESLSKLSLWQPNQVVHSVYEPNLAQKFSQLHIVDQIREADITDFRDDFDYLINRCEHLEKITIGAQHYPDQVIHLIKKCPCLTSLTIYSEAVLPLLDKLLTDAQDVLSRLDSFSLHQVASPGLSDSTCRPSIEQFTKLFSSMPQLKRLEFSCGIELFGRFSEPVCLHRLEELAFADRSKISACGPESLFQILTATPLLRKLSLGRVPLPWNKTVSDTYQGELHLNNLEELFINDIVDNLDLILASAPNLKQLSLPYVPDSFEDMLQRLPHLEKLSLTGCHEISAGLIKKILANLKNVHALYITNSYLNSPPDTDTTSCTFASLDKLEKLILPEDCYTEELAYNIISCAKNLRLLRCPYIFEDLHYDFLEELDMSSARVSMNSILKALCKMPRLRQLTLEHFVAADVHLPADLQLEHLETLSLKHSALYADTLSALLQAAPNLTSLCMDEFSEILGSLRCVDFHLPKLQNFSATNMQCTDALFCRLLTAADQVKTFLLDYDSIGGFLQDIPDHPLALTRFVVSHRPHHVICDWVLRNSNQLKELKVLGKDMLRFPQLDHLESLSIEASFISSQELLQTVLCAKNLKDLSLTDCAQLIEEFDWTIWQANPHCLKKLEKFYSIRSASDTLIEQIMKRAKGASFRGVARKVLHSTVLNAPSKPVYTFQRSYFSLDGKHPDPRMYRKEISTLKDGTLRPQFQNITDFIWVDTVDEIQNLWKKGDNDLYGVIELKPDEHVLDSITPYDKITHIAHADISIKYDYTCNLYAAVNHTKSPVKMHFLMQTKKYELQDPKICALVNQERRGPCTMRVQDLSTQMQNELPDVVIRAAGNEAHIFVEIFDKNWVVCDLGGSPADSIMYDDNNPDVTLKVQLTATAQSSFSDRIIVRGGRSLVILHSKNELEALSLWLQKQSKVQVVDFSNFDADEIKNYTFSIIKREFSFIGLYLLAGSFVPLTSEFTSNFSKKIELLPFDTNLVTEKKQVPQLPQKEIPLKIEKTESPLTLLQKIDEVRFQVSTFRREISFKLDVDPAADLPKNFDTFLQHYVLKWGKNSRIIPKSVKELDALSFWLRKALPDAYYIDTPDMLVCSARWMERINEHEGRHRRGQGGPLHDYLTSSDYPVLIINFANFTKNDIVKSNSAFDLENRKADGTAIAAEGCVIGLCLNLYRGTDYTDRFEPAIHLESFTPPSFELASSGHVKKINLYNSDDWENVCGGEWIIQGDRFFFQPGIFESLKDVEAVEIQNGPWHLREFSQYVQTAIAQRQLRVPGKVIPFNFTLSATESSFDSSWTHPIQHFPENGVLLNPSTFALCKRRHEIKAGKLQTHPGWVQEAKNKTVQAICTRPLNRAHWHELHDLCQTHNVRLEVLERFEAKAKIIITNNIDASIPKGAKVIDTSECDSRLVEIIDATWHNDLSFRFEKMLGACSDALGNNEHVVLKGSFSKELIDALMPLLLSAPKLTVVTSSKFGFEAITNCSVQIAMPASVKPECKVVENDPTRRLERVKQALLKEPHVILEGATGVGKSTFVKKELAKYYDVFIGMGEIRNWVKRTGKMRILFIDEANMQGKDYSEFEGLYYGGITDSGIYYETDDDCKVIFAVNPTDYGGERFEPAFFKRHPNKLEFGPLPKDYIYEHVLKPLGVKEKVANYFLDAYEFVLSLNRDTVALTPRDVEMMALLSRIRDPVYSAYTICRSVLKPHHLKAYIERFGMQKCDVVNKDLGDFVLTESRKEAYTLILDMLQLRKLNGGIRAIVLEGMPGDGKSHFASSVLKSEGFTEALPHKIKDTPNAFCNIPATMPQQEKMQCLLDAFNSGNIGIEDESNSTLELESCRNALLMGVDEQNNPAKKPGFMWIGTQNPSRFEGREETPLALQRRSIKTTLCPYPQREICVIAEKCHPKIPSAAIRALSYKFIQQKESSFRDFLGVMQKASSSEVMLLEPMPEPQEQKGQTCKLYALGTVMKWKGADIRVKGGENSLRKQAKTQFGSQVGEIYSPSTLVQLAKNNGFSSTKVLESDDYIALLKQLLNNGHAPVVFFDVDYDTGDPILKKSDHEHAAVVTGYFENLDGELFFTLTHWNKHWIVQAGALKQSAKNLLKNRPAETFYKIDKTWRTVNDRRDRGEVQYAIGKVPTRTGLQSSETFNNKILIIA